MEYLNKTTQETIDIIFLDINMRYKDGIECLKEIRRNPFFENILVLILSTSTNPEEVERAFMNGANLYISKPNFFNAEIAILKKIFTLNREQELLKPDKKDLF